MNQIALDIDFPPSMNSLWRVSGAGGMYRSKPYMAWRKKAMWDVAIQAKKRKISGHYKLTIRAVKPDKRKRDIDNIIKSVSDLLISAGVIEDDHLCQHLEALWVSEGHPCHVIIEEINNEKHERTEA